MPGAEPVLLDRRAPNPPGWDAAIAESRRGARAVWQYGVLTMSHGNGIFRFAGPDQQRTEARNPRDFLQRLRADSTSRLREGHSVEEGHATVLDHFGRDGWELVSCQFVRNSVAADVTSCHLKRPVGPLF